MIAPASPLLGGDRVSTTMPLWQKQQERTAFCNGPFDHFTCRCNDHVVGDVKVRKELSAKLNMLNIDNGLWCEIIPEKRPIIGLLICDTTR